MTENCFKFARATTTAGRGADICTTTREPFDRRSGRERRNGGAVQRGFVFCRSPFRISSLPDFSSRVSKRETARFLLSLPPPILSFPSNGSHKGFEGKKAGEKERRSRRSSLQRRKSAKSLPLAAYPRGAGLSKKRRPKRRTD